MISKTLRHLIRLAESAQGALEAPYQRACMTAAGRRAESWARACPEPSASLKLMSKLSNLQRFLFIHIPKCGGTSIRRALVHDGNCASVPVGNIQSVIQSRQLMAQAQSRHTLEGRILRDCLEPGDNESGWEHYLRTLATFVVALEPEYVFINGHLRGEDILPLKRNARDVLVTTVRDPKELLVSNTIYELGRTLEDDKRVDSAKLLRELGMNIDEFREMVSADPRELVARIIACRSPSLVDYLAFDDKRDPASIIAGLRKRQVFVGHISEYPQMMSRLLDREIGNYRQNTAKKRGNELGDFVAELPEWVDGHVESESVELYERLQSSGLIGNWNGEGSKEAYLELLQNAV